MTVRTIMSPAIAERVTSRITGVLYDHLGAVLPAASLTTLTLTLYDILTGNILNSVSAVNILNTGRGTVDTAGNMEIVLLPADNLLNNTALASERHIALIEWTWGSGARSGAREVEFTVSNVLKRP